MSIWTDFGFRDNPYATRPIGADEEGDRLLVGREQELRKLSLYLTSTSTHPTIEGANGVGKTSLVAVAGYRALRRFQTGESGQCFISLPQAFQLTANTDVFEFKRRAYLEVAQAFIRNGPDLKAGGLNCPDTALVNRWLNGTGDQSLNLGFNTAAFGGSIGAQRAPTTTSGFDDSGFFQTVENWMRECFPSQAAGGFVCLIDNLEILETSADARRLLEALRDELFNKAGLRWVLCGARGIIRSAASSSRLTGVLGDPIELPPVPDEFIPLVIERRVNEYRASPDTYIPVDAEGFRHIYDIVNRSLRDSLKYCEDFAVWMTMQSKQPPSSRDKFDLLEIWMAELAEKYTEATTGITQRAWQVFEQISKQGGNASPSEHAALGFNSPQRLRPYIKALEDSQLVVSAIDESDQRRRTISITSRGWIVRYYRSGFKKVTPSIGA